MIAGLALALLLHVTAVLAVLLATYQFIEDSRRAMASVRRVLNGWIIAAAVAFGALLALILRWRCP